MERKSKRVGSVERKSKRVGSVERKSKRVGSVERKSKRVGSVERKSKLVRSVAVLTPDKNISGNNVNGVVEFIQITPSTIEIKYDIKNLEDGEHGFHIHKCGDLTRGCSSGCEHFNPGNKTHGGLHDKDSHAGDLGNIKSENGTAKGTIKTNKITLRKGKSNIIGRMIIVHKGRDDLGRGRGEERKESLKTGNAGARLACGVIGIRSD